MIHLPTAVLCKLFLSLTTVAAVAEIVPPSPLSTGVEHLSLVGVLISGIIVLWRANGKKDEQLAAANKEAQAANDRKDDQVLAMQREATQALVATVDASKELRNVVAKLYDAAVQNTALQAAAAHTKR